MSNIDEKIGEGLVRIGAMTKKQVNEILVKQKSGDTRLFGEIAVDLGYVNVNAIIEYLKTKNKED